MHHSRLKLKKKPDICNVEIVRSESGNFSIGLTSPRIPDQGIATYLMNMPSDQVKKGNFSSSEDSPRIS